MHQSFLERGKSGPIDLLFLGDSITAYWTTAADLWDRRYARYQPANFGIGGDRTQHVIWRIENGELDGLTPKVVVLLIGTNNSGDYSADEIFAADKKIVDMIRAKIPQTRVLLLGIFPRGERKVAATGLPDDWVGRMKVIRAVNAQLRSFDNGASVRFLDFGDRYLDDHGKIPDALMPDHLHPSPAGYEIWAEAMQPLLDEMMK
jgi:beta-glucosidase